MLSTSHVLGVARRYLKPGGFLIDAGTLVGGSVAAQAIGFFAAPIITRLYTPNDFGYMTLIASFIGTLSAIACLRYQIAIVLPKANSKAYNVFALCLVIVLVFAISLFFLVAAFRHQIATWMSVAGLQKWLWFVPVGVLVSGLKLALDHWYTRTKKFFLLSISQITRSLTASTTKILAGLLVGSSTFWLITGNVVGIIGAALLLGATFIKHSLFDLRHGFTKNELRQVAKEFKKFPIYNAPTAILNSASQNIVIFMFAYYFPLEALGLYGLANSILRKPVQLVAKSIRRVFLQKAAEMQANGLGLSGPLMKATLGLAVLGLIPFGTIALSGEWLFSMFFGKQWAVAGYYAQLLTPWLFLLFINPPATQIILVKQKLFFELKYNILLTLSRAFAVITASFVSSEPWVAVAFFSAVGVIANIYILIYAFILVRTQTLKI